MQPRENIEQVLNKLRTLPPERIIEVEDFIDFLSSRNHDRTVTHAAQRAVEPVLEHVWDNAEDAVYDAL